MGLLRIDSRGYWTAQRGGRGTRETKTFGHNRTTTRAEATALYHRWLDDSPTKPSGSLTVSELCNAFLHWAYDYYPKTEHSETDNLSYTLQPFAQICGSIPAATLRPSHVKAWVESMKYLARSTIHTRLGRLKRCLKWAVSEELVEPTVLLAVQSVRVGRLGKVSPPVQPVAPVQVAVTLPHMAPTVRAMVRLQLATAMRPAEVCSLRGEAIHTDSFPWWVQLGQHKKAYMGLVRRIFFGPDARAILEPWLHDGLLFLNHEGEPFTTRTYRQAIWRACDLCSKNQGLKRLEFRWSPNQLRHTRLTELERSIGLDASRAVAGHSKLETTQQHYIARDDRLAKDAMEQAG